MRQLLFSFAFIFFSAAHASDMLVAHVIGISDGDTITVLDTEHRQHKIRLAGIDAPESKQAFGQASKKRLSAMVFDRDVLLECGKTDRYQREVCVVNVDGKDANVAQVEAGMAWWYRKYQGEQTSRQREDYEAAEYRARAAGSGLWADRDPMPPWVWRQETGKRKLPPDR
jgi:endonuclease YncB( thermonuclease family)